MNGVDVKISLTAAVSLAWMLVATAANMCRAAGTDGVCSQLRGQFADLDKLTVRYADAVAARARTNEVAVWRTSIREDGSWADIDYASKIRATWPTANHLFRLSALAAAGRATGNKETLAAAHAALGYWCRKRFGNPNWWWPTIGIPLYLGNAALLMDAVLTEKERGDVVWIMTVGGDSHMTGQNFAWMAENRLRRGLLARDGKVVRKALADMLSVVRMGNPEGIRSDWCFHQHGAQPQFGNYGLSFLCDQARLSVILAGTEFAYPPEKLELVRRLAGEGYAWITWKGMMDISAMGRQLDCGMQAGKAKGVARAFADLERSGWTRPPDPVGFRYFNCSAYAVYRTANWMASIRASTPKIIGTETGINEDNVKGMCMADGALMTYVTGREYDGALPLWDDWRMVPGVTGYLGKPVMRKDSRNQMDDIVASGDGERGMFAFTFAREGLTARKKWTFDRGGVLCEGSGITATDGRYEVATSVEQAMAAPDAGVVYRRPDASCFRNGAITYTVYAPPEEIRFELADRTGDYSTFMRAHIPTPVSGKVFSLRILHGKRPKDASYRYRIDIGKQGG